MTNQDDLHPRRQDEAQENPMQYNLLSGRNTVLKIIFYQKQVHREIHFRKKVSHLTNGKKRQAVIRSCTEILQHAERKRENRMNWTEQQTEAITAEGSDILVSAAAGSGKTAVLTERIKRLVTEKNIPLERMLVVTFTNAAASEMKEKILDALRKEEARLAQSRQDADSQRRKKFIRRQIRNASAAEICTFHRFSMDVIRRYFFLTDIDPHFSICDESYASILREKCLDDLFEDRFASGDDSFRIFLDAYSELKGEDRVRRMILRTYDFIMNMAEPFPWLHQQVEKLNCTAEELRNSPAYIALRAGVRKETERALGIAEGLTALAAEIPELDIREDEKSTIYQKVEGNTEMIREILRDFDQMPDEILASRMADLKWNRLTPRKHEKEAFQQVKDLFSAQNKEFKDILKKAASRLPRFSTEDSAERIRATYPYAVILEQLTAEFAERFTAAKRDKNMLDFNDVEHEAYRILSSREHPEAAQEYRDRFDAIFIDEYQDSSRIQEAIIRSVSRGGNVYMVGDVKQSIYKFRQADPDLFIRKYNGFEEGTLPGHRIDLSRNFRSKGGIINAVNGVFRHIMTRELSGIAYDEAAELVQGSSYPAGDTLDYGVSLHLIDIAGDQNPESDSPQADGVDEEIAQLSRAQWEGQLIAQLAEERVGQRIYDDKLGTERNAGYGDIVILVRSGTNMDIYARALMNRGLPAYVSGGEGFYETPEIEVFMDLLKIIDNRRRDKELISVLYSSMEGFHFSVNELASIRIHHMEGSYYEAFSSFCQRSESAETDEEKKLAEKCIRAAAQLDSWREESRYLPLDDFLWKLMNDTGYYGYVAALPGGTRRAANLRLLVTKAAEYAGSYGGGLFSFLRFEEQMKQKGARIPQASNTGDTSNMIQIMTIHKSKGLEFPIVIVPDLGANIRHDSDSTDLQLHKDLGIALKYRSHSEHIEYWTLPYQSIIQTKREEDLEEEKRILYVAMTRAKDELILTSARKDLSRQLEQYRKIHGRAQSPDQRLYWVYLNAEDAGIRISLYRPEDFLSAARKEEALTGQVLSDLENGFPDFRDTEGLTGIIQKRLDYLYPYRRESAAKSKYSVTELNRAMNGGELNPVQYLQITRSEQEEDETLLSEEKHRDIFSPEAPAPEDTDALPEEYRSSEQSQSVIQTESLIPRFLAGDQTITPAARGTLTHKVLELIDYSEDHTEESVRHFCRSLIDRGILTSAEAEVIPCGQIASFFSSEPGRRACRAVQRRSEWAFTLRKRTSELAAAAASPEIGRRLKESLPEIILVQGIIDCCFRDENGFVVIDFKTDHVRPSDYRNDFHRFREHYRRQLDFYREAVEKEYGESVREMYLYLLDAGRVVDMS